MTANTSRAAQSAFERDPRPLVAFDWSFHKIHITFDGKTVTVMADIDELVDSLTSPHKMAAEATFESWDRDRRTRILERLRREGHELYVYRPIHTRRRRPEGMKKSDENDARVIHAIAASTPVHLYPVPDPEPAWFEIAAAANTDYQQARLAGQKPDLVGAAADILGPYQELEGDAALVLGNGKHYRESLVAAVYFAATRARSRDGFERLLGLNGSGYPSLLRSDVHHHSFRHVKGTVGWPTFRRELRRAYREIRDHIDAS